MQEYSLEVKDLAAFGVLMKLFLCLGKMLWQHHVYQCGKIGIPEKPDSCLSLRLPQVTIGIDNPVACNHLLDVAIRISRM
jgi:hypothetical protein